MELQDTTLIRLFVEDFSILVTRIFYSIVLSIRRKKDIRERSLIDSELAKRVLTDWEIWGNHVNLIL